MKRIIIICMILATSTFSMTLREARDLTKAIYENHTGYVFDIPVYGSVEEPYDKVIDDEVIEMVTAGSYHNVRYVTFFFFEEVVAENISYNIHQFSLNTYNESLSIILHELSHKLVFDIHDKLDHGKEFHAQFKELTEKYAYLKEGDE